MIASIFFIALRLLARRVTPADRAALSVSRLRAKPAFALISYVSQCLTVKPGEVLRIFFAVKWPRLITI
jgi:hypothetical protein